MLNFPDEKTQHAGTVRFYSSPEPVDDGSSGLFACLYQYLFLFLIFTVNTHVFISITPLNGASHARAQV